MAAFPKLVAFDLDFTLWNVWVDTHVSGSLTSSKKIGACHDRNGTEMHLYQDVPEILRSIRTAMPSSIIAACSRTQMPHMAQQALDVIRIDDTGTKLRSMFDHLEIYPGCPSYH